MTAFNNKQYTPELEKWILRTNKVILVDWI